MLACSTGSWCAEPPYRDAWVSAPGFVLFPLHGMGRLSLLGDHQQAVALTVCGAKQPAMRQRDDGAIHCVSQGCVSAGVVIDWSQAMPQFAGLQ